MERISYDEFVERVSKGIRENGYESWNGACNGVGCDECPFETKNKTCRAVNTCFKIAKQRSTASKLRKLFT
jgi:hypothetical protein